MFTQTDDTICAIATGGETAAIATLRVSGSDSIRLCSPHFRPRNARKTLEVAAGYSLHFGTWHQWGEDIDEVLLSVFRAPRSYTGQDVVEISCHGSPYLQQRILQSLVDAGCRLAEPGEFTARAFLNGKMDLAQSEAVGDLIASGTAASARIALNQMRGGFSRELSELRSQLIDFVSLIELELDFAEEDVDFADRTALRALLATIIARADALCDTFRYGNALRQGIPVALVGAPNAGKSTLLNALVGDERALVSDIAGTTRDTVEDEVVLGGLRFRFIDTAGIRTTTDVVESMGIARTRAKMASASQVVVLYGSETPPAERERLWQEVESTAPHADRLLVANKSDAEHHPRPAWLAPTAEFLQISARTGQGMDALQRWMVARAEAHRPEGNATVVTNLRHYEALSRMGQACRRALEGLESGLSGELLSADIREALRHLGNITGHIELDRDILGNIFGKFCIGK